MTNDAISEIDSVIDLIDHSSLVYKNYNIGSKDISLNTFHNALYLANDVSCISDEAIVFIPNQNELKDMLLNFSETTTLRIFNKLTDDEAPVQFTKITKISPKEARGKVTNILPNIFKLNLLFGENNHLSGGYVYRAYTGNGWMNIDNRQTTKMIPATKKESDALTMSVSIEFTNRYYWRASIGLSPEFMISFHITNDEIKELFNDREKAQGKQRKDALRNWISRHKRKIAENNYTDVRRHLRGQTDFFWNGYYVKIMPSKFDLEQNSISLKS